MQTLYRRMLRLLPRLGLQVTDLGPGSAVVARHGGPYRVTDVAPGTTLLSRRERFAVTGVNEDTWILRRTGGGRAQDPSRGRRPVGRHGSPAVPGGSEAPGRAHVPALSRSVPVCAARERDARAVRRELRLRRRREHRPVRQAAAQDRLHRPHRVLRAHLGRVRAAREGRREGSRLAGVPVRARPRGEHRRDPHGAG